MEAGLMAREMGSHFQVFVLGAPRIYSGFPAFPFLLPDNLCSDLNADSLASLDMAPGQSTGIFAILENQAMLTKMSQKHPGGESGRV